MKKKLAIKTFGCKINQYESACMADAFIRKNYEITDFETEADVYLINTCTVTGRTDYKSRNSIRKALAQKAKNPDATVMVTGCYAQRNKDAVEELGEVDYVIDNNSKNRVTEILKAKINRFENILEAEDFAEMSTGQMLDKTRIFIKVQDGCDFYCSYCAIPYARGHSRSRKKEKVLEQIKILTERGYAEFVLGGINLGLYGCDLYEDYNLVSLLKDIEKTDGVKIIRLSSVEPQLITDELAEFYFKSEKMAPHLHIPLQAGTDNLLKLMNRRYSTKEFYELLKKILQNRPDTALGFDLIVGLPGETEQDITETLDFIDKITFAYIHLFTYSSRPGTKAEKMPDHPAGNIVKERKNRLQKAILNKKNAYLEYLLKNKIKLGCIAEKNEEPGGSGLSDHYVRIYWKENCYNNGEFVMGFPVRLYKEGLLIKPEKN
ncbi:MAG: tRNA (N(6)-L-threonylcarbamoyladenosine(37)-C(2))-methylthiotransferase MtaB [Candidatus Cloacimonadota bacterium]|nr:MAG: tRNA (N(6)-L-threonylcarbamoyladenosine(37)-C(2))-methylthiotransferase MtaB [Candidatus Cloacimonadota bacterium]